jgi:methyl halide transferase
MDSNTLQSYWDHRYQENATGWDIGYPSTPIKEYIDQIKDKSISILIPGAGNAYEAEYLLAQGFKNVYVMDVSAIPLNHFKERNPHFSDDQLLQADFFEHSGSYDLILEQTFFCSFEPTEYNRIQYAKQCADLLRENGKLVGVWFDIPLIEGNMEKRPFGGSQSEYSAYFEPYFMEKTFEPCRNSIPPRMGTELFGIFIKNKKAQDPKDLGF